MMTRPDRSAEMDAFLARIGWGGALRQKLAADASFRRYERVMRDGSIAILMDAPPPWEDVRPFITVTGQLAQGGASVPTIIAADEAEGFLLLEDLGDASFTRLLKETPEREMALYEAATEALVQLGNAGKPTTPLPPYDMAVYLREVGLFAEWFLPQVVGMAKAQLLRAEWLELWRELITETGLQQSILVHRDYHADNLFWLADRAGHKAVGMLDYQDALWGDPAYDLASLLEDARRDVTSETAAHCLRYFLKHTDEQADDFMLRYALLAAQRNAKIIGIFTRLCVRDGKAHYLHYLPRVWGHFMRDISHPSLMAIHQFVETHVPVEWRGVFAADTSIGGMAA